MKKTETVAFSLTKKHHDIVRRVAKKFKTSKSAVIRARIKSFDQMLVELREDMKHSDVIDFDRM
jgi:hypothetical protein